MTKILASGISPFDLRNNKVPAGSTAVRLNYMNKNTENTITKYPVVGFDKNGKYSKNASRSIPGMQYSELRNNMPQQKWITDSANILLPKKPVTASIGVQTESVGTSPMYPVLPSGVPNIPVSSQGVPITTQTDMWQPAEPSPMVDASIQTWHTGALEPSSQIINNHYHQVTPVSNFNTTNQQFVNHTVDASTTNQQVINNTNQQQIINNTVVQQEMLHMVDNRMQLAVNQNNLQQTLQIITDPSLSQPFNYQPRQFDAGTQIVLDRNALIDEDMGGIQAIEYPSNWATYPTYPNSIEEPMSPSTAVATFNAPRDIPRKIIKRKNAPSSASGRVKRIKYPKKTYAQAVANS